MQFEGGDQEKMIEYETWMRLNNSVLRHMTVLLDDKPEVYSEEKELKKADQKASDSKNNSSAENPEDSPEADPNKNLKEEVD